MQGLSLLSYAVNTMNARKYIIPRGLLLSLWKYIIPRGLILPLCNEAADMVMDDRLLSDDLHIQGLFLCSQRQMASIDSQYTLPDDDGVMFQIIIDHKCSLYTLLQARYINTGA